MSAALLLLAWVVPVLAAAFSLPRAGRWLPVLAAVPALAAALAVPVGFQMSIPWLLLGSTFGLDETGRAFLLFSALLWLAAALYGMGAMARDPRVGRFRCFFLLAMAGNFCLVLAQDMPGFYLGYALMGLSAYGLVTHDGSPRSARAGRVYLAWTLVGELLLFVALVMLAVQAGGTAFSGLAGVAPTDMAVALLVLGFGIKLALPGLHVWLPLAYPAAPAAGAAVLSGPMITAGLLGWMRFLPPGTPGTEDWGAGLVGVGLLAAFFGVAMGLVQRDPKVVLGYSSIAKMGLVTLGYGVSLAAPEAAPAMLAAVTFYAVNHLVLKGALFLGVDLPRRGSARPWALGGLAVLSAALAGAPLTGGAAAKAAVSGALPQDWAWLAGWLAVATLASTLLMVRLLYLVSVESPPAPARGPTAWTAWGAVFPIVMLLPISFGEPMNSTYGWLAVASGAALAGAVVVLRPRWPSLLVGRVPPGDVLSLAPMVFGRGARAAVCMTRAASATSGALREGLAALAQAWHWQRGPGSSAPIPWPVAGAIWLTLSGLLLAGLIAGAG